VIDSDHHVLINGVPYRLAEDAEGEHYIYDTPTLRAPNSQIIQGGDPGEVNIEPGTIIWKLDTWTDGEGQLKFNPENPGRSEILEGVNFFGRPGNLFLGYEPNITQANGGGDFSDEVGLVVARNELYVMGIGSASDDYYAWDGPLDWGAADQVTTTTDGAMSALAMAGDGQYLFFIKTGSDAIMRWDGSTWTTHNNQTENETAQLAELGDYLYKYDDTGKVWELSKVTGNTSTAETPILDFSAQGTVRRFTHRKIVAGDNRLYVLATYKYQSVLYEIVPTSAAQTGFGREILRLKGMRAESVWHHGGFVYWTGVDHEADGIVGARRVIYYLQPDRSHGTLGELRSFDLGQRVPGGITMLGASRLNTFGLISAGTYTGRDEDDAEIDLWEVDAISGGYGIGGKGSSLVLTEHYEATSMEFHEGKVFATIKDEATGSTHRVIFWDVTEYDTAGMAISPAHDMGLASSKVLEAIETELDPLPAGTEVQISYSLDGGSWTALTNNTTDGSTGTLEVVSTDTAVKSFRSIRIKVALVGTASATPVVRSVNVRASANETGKVWQLLLDCTDESSVRGFSGAKLEANIRALSNTVIAFRDGYQDRNPNSYTEYDTLVERVTIINDHPGEGIAQIILREVD
jgi:hypothetical protein